MQTAAELASLKKKLNAFLSRLQDLLVDLEIDADIPLDGDVVVRAEVEKVASKYGFNVEDGLRDRVARDAIAFYLAVAHDVSLAAEFCGVKEITIKQRCARHAKRVERSER